MADYWVSFRIHYDSSASYDKRYDALQQAITDCVNGSVTWDTTTSFVAIRSAHDLVTVTGHLKKAINVATDHVVVRRIGFTNTAYCGSPGTNFLTFFPDAQKV